MSSNPALIQEIIDARKGAVQEFGNLWFGYRIKTASRAFRFYFKSFEDHLLQTACDDSTKEELVERALAIFDNRAHSATGHSGFKKEGTIDRIGSCDSIISLAPIFHRYNLEFGRSTHQRTFAIFPCHHNEFMHDETPETFNAVRSNLTLPIWDRKPEPRTSMRYVNPKIKSKSAGKEFGVTSEKYALSQAEAMWGANGAFMDIKNHRNEVANVRPDALNCTISASGGVIRVDSLIELRCWLSSFLRKP